MPGVEDETRSRQQHLQDLEQILLSIIEDLVDFQTLPYSKAEEVAETMQDWQPTAISTGKPATKFTLLQMPLPCSAWRCGVQQMPLSSLC